MSCACHVVVPPLRSGIVGGARRIFDPFLQRLTQVIVQHHRRWLGHPPVPPRSGLSSMATVADEATIPAPSMGMSASVPVDMLALNDVVVADEHAGAQVALRGFPLGPVNLPFWGDVCGSNCSEPSCKLDEMAALIPHYVFSHKVKFPWNRVFTTPSPAKSVQDRRRRRMMLLTQSPTQST